MARKAKSKGGKKAKTFKPRSRVEAAPAAESTPATEVAADAAPADAPAADATPKTREKAERKDGTMSGLDAAAKVLAEAGEPLDCKTIVERAIGQGLWKPGGKTPHATVYSAMLREIQKKGDASRFRKTERGHFTVAS